MAGISSISADWFFGFPSLASLISDNSQSILEILVLILLQISWNLWNTPDFYKFSWVWMKLWAEWFHIIFCPRKVLMERVSAAGVFKFLNLAGNSPKNSSFFLMFHWQLAASSVDRLNSEQHLYQAWGHKKNICCQKYFVTSSVFKLQKWFLHQNGVEFNQKSKSVFMRTPAVCALWLWALNQENLKSETMPIWANPDI